MGRILNIYGNGIIVNIGNNVNISVIIIVIKGNKDELKKYMNDIGVFELEMEELINIIDVDELDKFIGILGNCVRGWISMMFDKVFNGIVKIIISVVGNLLVIGIK